MLIVTVSPTLCLLMIVDNINLKYLPSSLDGGSGKGDSKPKGMIQFWLQGLPNRKFATKLWKKIDEPVRKKCKTFDEFIDLYFQTMYKLEKQLRKQYASIVNIFDDDAEETDPEEPYDYKKSKDGHKTRSRVQESSQDLADVSRVQ